MTRRARVGAAASAAAAGWLGVSGLVYWRAFGRLPRHWRDERVLTPADFDLAHERLPVITADGLRIAAWVLPGPRDAVVVVSSGHRRHASDLLGISAALHRAGFSVVAHGWRGTLGSDDAPHTLGVLERLDLIAVLEAVTRRFQGMPIGLLGYSLGGAVAISVAAGDARVRGVCSDSAFADPTDLLAGRIRERLHLPPGPVLAPVTALLTRRSGARLGELSPVRDVGRISPRPLLLIHGEADRPVPVGDARRLFAAAGEPRELWVLPDVGHAGAYFAGRAEYVGRVTAFFGAALH